jgi:predicted signal transduction protein with EAL and GGDEF domain
MEEAPRKLLISTAIFCPAHSAAIMDSARRSMSTGADIALIATEICPKNIAITINLNVHAFCLIILL